jgi:hypothetical protein
MADEQTQKIGQGHLKAMLRQGAKELAQILPAFPSSAVQPVEEPGLVGNLTPQEVVQDKGAQQSYQSMLNGYTVHGKSEPQRQAIER